MIYQFKTPFAWIKNLSRLAESNSDYQFQPQTPAPLGTPRFPQEMKLRPYQEQALKSWFSNQGKGILKMATGSGKTITALAIATKLYQKLGLQVLLIICPYRHLVLQWNRECLKFGLEPILAFDSLKEWAEQLNRALYLIITNQKKFVTIITTNSTLIKETFQTQLKYLPPKSLIIGDEAHNLGAQKLEESLPDFIPLRLALSATPERHFDQSGTDAIFRYFGDILSPEFTLKDAISQGALVPYNYYPILVELTPEESISYIKLTKSIGRIILYEKLPNVSLEDLSVNEQLKPLLIKRARLIGAAANKLVALKQLMIDRLNTTHTLFYCGDGSIDSNNQLKAVTKLLGIDLGYRVSTYTAQTKIDDREKLRLDFEEGKLQGLVAIRCLDEGVDIPAIKTAVILASSGNPRQFIQRRGRILRPYPHKQRATLFDMIVLPPELDRETLEVERNLLRKELKRFTEFADLADNSGEARLKLLELQKRYNLLDF